ncbi:MAG: RNA methyltransferase [Acidobacteria bacterium]|nr:RNA methyltransferase [Acidobacteriota bacterium]
MAIHPDDEGARPIPGRHHSLLKELRQAFARGELTSAGDCAVEGFRIIEEAIRSRAKLRAVFVRQGSQARASRLLPQLGSHVDVFRLPDRTFDSIVPSQAPQGVAALVAIKTFSSAEVMDSVRGGPLLVIAGVQDPGNLGTILRSAEAFGAKGVCLGEGTVSAYNSKVIRASAGAVFRIPLARVELPPLIEELRTRGIRLVATSAHKGVSVDSVQRGGKAAIFIGNEGAGIPKKLLREMDELIVIPHSPTVESLNAGVAAAIVLYEFSKQSFGSAVGDEAG